ncbi:MULTISPECIES: hypothetical protein [unclassified Streptomyces]|uniref:hypothetical protein n=1 Tax=unclassified Streptomyces TaxID=2593676 RepID=UPI00224F6CA6|nr:MULTISPECIES: hypothetical protein [unclassified Streptomyces]WSP53203.1 hypothetical protein OG306_01250 [Streptomyces sp. NBC_01241]MCX4792110.1 hypothetical protein [Streptomyces sp. NBC_01221]MCX4799963.1 hypothetical protein [Streptomyces sp. NBC_01242]WSJ40643.1 hypothetical protein OG772_34995 [Streptomyces sp. NBC_01321]WSP66963.1 hypothetical protein OG466_37745 [Streptomyces sp. NBC_01240]
MPETTATEILTPMHPDDVFSAFAYIRAVQARDIDTASMVVKELGTELHWLLLDIAERVIVPVTALDDQNEELRADPFALEALGRILLEVLRDGDALCPTVGTAIARTVIRFAEKILTEEGQDVADVLAQLQAAGVEQAMQVMRAYGAPVGTHPAGASAV